VTIVLQETRAVDPPLEWNFVISALRVWHFGNYDDKEPGHFTLKTSKS
jgi:hypothetical protein